MWIRQGHSLGKDHCFLSSLPLLWRALLKLLVRHSAFGVAEVPRLRDWRKPHLAKPEAATRC